MTLRELSSRCCRRVILIPTRVIPFLCSSDDAELAEIHSVHMTVCKITVCRGVFNNDNLFYPCFHAMRKRILHFSRQNTIFSVFFKTRLTKYFDIIIMKDISDSVLIL